MLTYCLSNMSAYIHFDRLVFTLFLIESVYLDNTPNYDFFQVVAFNSVERSLLYKIHVDNYSVIFLNGVTNEAAMPMQIIVEDYASDLFQDALRAYGVEYSHSNLEPRHKEQSPYEESLNYNSTTFWDWTTINSWISKMQQKYPLLKKQILALTYEGREVFTLSFTKNKKNPIIVIVGGEQGKDRNSVAIIIALLHELLEDNIFYELLDYLSFYFIPIMNPDGYVYSMEKSEFWAKNRRVFFPKRKCDWTLNDEDNVAIGVNMERNWYYENELNTQEDICNTVYLGHKSLSEKETHGLASFLNDHAAKLMGYINVIGYGNRLITLPYANTLQQSINHGIMMDIILSACEKVQYEHNATYFNGQSARFFYNISGNSADWVKFKLNVPLVYTVYMKYKDESIPNPRNIIPLSKQLRTILQQTLITSKEFYGPLFNSYRNIFNINTTVLIITSIVHLLFYHIEKINQK